jgi:hypothetical protein
MNPTVNLNTGLDYKIYRDIYRRLENAAMMDISGNLFVAGDATICGELLVDTLTIKTNSDIDVSGNFEIKGELLVQDTATFCGNLEVDTIVPKTNGDIVIDGNLIINGSTTTIESDELVIKDCAIELCKDNVADMKDSGLYTGYFDGSGTKFSGIIRDSMSKKWLIFDDMDQSPSQGNDYLSNLGELQLENIYVNQDAIVCGVIYVDKIQGKTSSIVNICDLAVNNLGEKTTGSGINILHNTRFLNDVRIENNLRIVGNLDVDGFLDIGGVYYDDVIAETICGNVSLSSNLIVPKTGSTIDISGNLNVSGTVTLNDNLELVSLSVTDCIRADVIKDRTGFGIDVSGNIRIDGDLNSTDKFVLIMNY